jgi:peptidoglycan/xylan/chitin deacetylase (PgdA/CDA1 family)
VIRASTLARLDELAFRVQAMRNPGRYGVIVAAHETPVSLESQLRQQLSWVAARFSITTLEKFATLWEENSEWDSGAKPPVLFTFDDGRESNHTVAAPLLESFGGRGVFFVVPSFANCSPDQALAFYRVHINPDSKPGDEAWEDWKPMSPRQIADLSARGHSIGNHSLSHRKLVGLSAETLEGEIGDSARLIRSWIGKPADAFAWTFGWDSLDREAWEMIKRYHRFCFAPCPGAIDVRADQPTLLWRREVEAKYSPAEYHFLYSGLVDVWWGRRRKRLREMLKGHQG